MAGSNPAAQRPGRAVVSLRAELVRLGLRWLMKPSNRTAVTIAERRERLARFARRVPLPPREAEIRRGELAGIATSWIAMPAARPGRQILFLHGGGYVTGSTELYRHILWRIAEASAAQIA